MVERIKQIIEKLQLSHTQFAETIGINRSNLTHLFSGRNQPSLDLMRKILVAYPQIKTEWLIMGVGEMFADEPAQSEASAQTPAPTPAPVKPTTSPREPITLDLFATQEEAALLPNSNDEMTEETLEEAVQEVPAEEPVAPPQPESPAPTARKNGAKRVSETSGDSNIRTRKDSSPRISHSQSDKKLEKVILFYSDGTFEVYQN